MEFQKLPVVSQIRLKRAKEGDFRHTARVNFSLNEIGENCSFPRSSVFIKNHLIY